MKNPLQFTLLAGAIATAGLSAQDVTAIYDWQFNEEAGSSVFVDVANAGIGEASFGDWQTYTTDGNGNWQIGDATGQSNKFSSIFLFQDETPVTNGVWEINIRVAAWDFDNASAADSSQLIFGVINSNSDILQAKITNNGNAIKLIDASNTSVANFKAGSEDSSNITSDGIPLGTDGQAIEGAPVLQTNAVFYLKLTINLDAGTWDYSYAIDDSEFFSVANGDYAGDIQKFRLATQNMQAEDLFWVDYITFSGTGDVPQPAASPWADVYPLVDGVARDTGIGWINDDLYPLVYHFNGVTWLYIVPDGASLDSMFGYSYTGGYWFWTSDGYGSWHFNYNIGDWQSWIPVE